MMMPPPGMAPQQAQGFANFAQSQLRQQGIDPRQFGLGAPQQQPKTGGGFQVPKDGSHMYSPGQAQAKQSPWSTSTPYDPNQGQPFGAWAPRQPQPGQGRPPHSPQQTPVVGSTFDWNQSVQLQHGPGDFTPVDPRKELADRFKGQQHGPALPAWVPISHAPLPRPGLNGMPMGGMGPDAQRLAPQPQMGQSQPTSPPQRPPAFQSMTQNFDGTQSQMPSFQQRDAFIQQINSQLGQMQGQSWNQQMGAPQFNFPQMWGQAGNMVQQGWQNPFAMPQ